MLGKSYFMETTVEGFDQVVVGGTARSSEMIVLLCCSDIFFGGSDRYLNRSIYIVFEACVLSVS